MLLLLDVLVRLRLLARMEAELLFREYKNYPGKPLFYYSHSPCHTVHPLHSLPNLLFKTHHLTTSHHKCLTVSYPMTSVWQHLILFILPYLSVGALPHFSERISFAIGKVTDAVTDALAGSHSRTYTHMFCGPALFGSPFIIFLSLDGLLCTVMSSPS